jgi:FlaA1/EpsC-like NDP-sugar epimerase
MGATKRLAEMYIQALYAAHPGRTKFMAVRFGNVLGSSGSVIPVFHRQIAEGGPVRVTHPDMTRYFMTIPEASGLVLQSAMQGTGGEIFVLDMGKSVKPDEDIQIEFVGIRPGEKLFEELTHTGENFVPTTHPKICRFISAPVELARMRETLERLRGHLHRTGARQIKLLLREAVPDYTPYLPPSEASPPAVAEPPNSAAAPV